MFELGENSLKGMKVLIVDDTPDNIEILVFLLKKSGLDIAIAVNGEKALELVTKFNPDLILLDIMMPGMDGYDVCRKLKKDVNHKNIPVIFITALSEDEQVIKGFEVGGVDYISKPFKAEIVLCRVNTQLQFIKNKKELLQAQKLAAIGRITNNMAHEILNPLNIISIKGQLLSRKLGSKESQSKELLKTIEEQIQRVLSLINSLALISKSSSKEQSANVNDLLEQTIDPIKKDEKFKDIKILTRLYSQLPNMQIDPDELARVFHNLTSNACEAMPQGGTLTIESALVSNSHPEAIRISFSDTGTGIANENLEKQFEPFFTTKKDLYGVGMGLFVCQGIVEKYHGSIKVKSTVGQGTTFSVLLPTT
jgi:two-component system sensor histidine kinase/response regulator